MKNRIIYTVAAMIVCCAFVLLPCTARAQQQPMAPDLTIDSATRSAVLDILLKELNETYVFPETAKKMETDVRARAGANEYDSITSARAFAEKLTTDLQSVSKDKHLRIRYSYEVLPSRQDRREPTEAEIEQSKWFNKRINYGFEKIERMNGNVGYIDL